MKNENNKIKTLFLISTLIFFLVSTFSSGYVYDPATKYSMIYGFPNNCATGSYVIGLNKTSLVCSAVNSSAGGTVTSVLVVGDGLNPANITTSGNVSLNTTYFQNIYMSLSSAYGNLTNKTYAESTYQKIINAQNLSGNCSSGLVLIGVSNNTLYCNSISNITGSTNISGSGTVGKITKWVASTQLGDSSIIEGTNSVNVSTNLTITGTGNGLIFPDGTRQTTASSGGLDGVYGVRMAGLNYIRQLINSTQTESTGYIDFFGDVYINASGRDVTVVTANTTAIFNTNKYSGTYGVSSSYVEIANATTSAGSYNNFSFLANVLVNGVFSSIQTEPSSGAGPCSATMISNNGKSNATAQGIIDGNGFCSLNFTYNGIGYLEAGTQVNITINYNLSTSGTIGTSIINFSGTYFNLSNNSRVPIKMSLKFNNSVNYNITEHNIPSGKFASNISKFVCTAMYQNKTFGSSVMCRIYNANNNSGWVAENTVGSFTAFSTEPNKLQVALMPNSSNSGPSIFGIAVAEVD